MNDSDLHNLFSRMKSEKLSPVERSRIREQLLLRIRTGAVPTYREFSFMRFIWVSATRRSTVAVFAVLVIVFGGVSYAAESALPGDALYSLKTGLNEPLRSVLAVSNTAKANLEAELADLRLAEVSTLALEDRLDEFVQEKLLMQAAQHATSLRVRLDKSSDDLDEEDVAKLAFRLESSREVRNNLTARVSPVPTAMALRASASQSEAMSAPAPTAMMMAAEAPSVQQDSSRILKVSDSGNLGETAQSPSEVQLRRVEEEYEKALSILGARIGKISREKEDRIRSRDTEESPDSSSSGEVKGVSEQGPSSVIDDSPDMGDDDSNTRSDRRRGATKAED